MRTLAFDLNQVRSHWRVLSRAVKRYDLPVMRVGMVIGGSGVTNNCRIKLETRKVLRSEAISKEDMRGLADLLDVGDERKRLTKIIGLSNRKNCYFLR